jgi:predicted metal-dependent hydrolase
MVKPFKKPEDPLNPSQSKPKLKQLTLRIDIDTREIAHRAARNLYDQTLSEFLNGKIKKLISEYENELPRIKHIAEKERKEAAQRGREIKKEEAKLKTRRMGRPRKPQECERIYLIDIGMD